MFMTESMKLKTKEKMLEYLSKYEPHLVTGFFGYGKSAMKDCKEPVVTFDNVYSVTADYGADFKLLIEHGASKESVLKFLDDASDKINEDGVWEWVSCVPSDESDRHNKTMEQLDKMK